MKLADLSRAGRSPRLPLRLQLPNDELELLQWLRVLPNRRYVALAKWQGRPVVAKLLVGVKSGRQYRQELNGSGLLAAQEFATPALLSHGHRQGAGGWLLFDFLETAKNLNDQWLTVAGQKPLSPDQERLLKAALEAIGALHSRGLWQSDLHLDNLLCQNDRLFWIDGGSIRCVRPGNPLEPARALDNLGLFFAQLPASFDGFVGRLMAHYWRGGGQPSVEVGRLQRRIVEVRHRRLRDFLGKIGRDCSQFSVRRGPGGLQAVLRDELVRLQPLLDDPDHYIERGTSLKAGHSSTVAQIAIDGRQLVIKRYNIKGFRHWLRRCWRPSRAWHAWREGHRLAFLGLAAPRPLAMLEYRCCWLRKRAYLVLEYLEGEDLRRRFAPYVHSSPPEAEVAALVSLFEKLVRERICHGDLKGSNLIWHAGRWTLVDLDAVHQCSSDRGFASPYEQDRQRLLRNWPPDSALYRLLDARLPHA